MALLAVYGPRTLGLAGGRRAGSGPGDQLGPLSRSPALPVSGDQAVDLKSREGAWVRCEARDRTAAVSLSVEEVGAAVGDLLEVEVWSEASSWAVTECLTIMSFARPGRPQRAGSRWAAPAEAPARKVAVRVGSVAGYQVSLRSSAETPERVLFVRYRRLRDAGGLMDSAEAPEEPLDTCRAFGIVIAEARGFRPGEMEELGLRVPAAPRSASGPRLAVDLEQCLADVTALSDRPGRKAAGKATEGDSGRATGGTN